MHTLQTWLATLPHSFNILDLLIIGIILFYAYEGYTVGFTLAVIDLISFVSAFIIALKGYVYAADVLTTGFSLPLGVANALGFFFTALLFEILLNILFRKAIRHFPQISVQRPLVHFFTKINHLLGMIPGVFSAFIVISFLLTVIISLPSSPLIKTLVTHSSIGSLLIANTSLLEKQLNDIFGGALNDTLTFMTVKPEGNESVDLRFHVTDGTVDADAEQMMFSLVNTERKKAGLDPVAFDQTLRDVARAHSTDMFKRGYFSHYTPEGLSPFDRMHAAGIDYIFAGENLALAPTTTLAMQGLMNSPGHRANILNAHFRKIGIGVIDGGSYGEMFSQEFTD